MCTGGAKWNKGDDSDYHIEDEDSGSDVCSEVCALDQHLDSAPATLEGECHKLVTDGLDSVHLREAHEALQDDTGNAASLQRHIDDLCTDGTLARVADWRLCCMVVYGQVIPEVADIKRPPTEPECKQILLAAKLTVSSMKCLEHDVGSVCWVADHLANDATENRDVDLANEHTEPCNDMPWLRKIRKDEDGNDCDGPSVRDLRGSLKRRIHDQQRLGQTLSTGREKESSFRVQLSARASAQVSGGVVVLIFVCLRSQIKLPSKSKSNASLQVRSVLSSRFDNCLLLYVIRLALFLSNLIT